MLLTQTPSQTFKIIVMNPDDHFYVVHLTSPITIQIWENDTLMPIACLDNKIYKLNAVDFSVQPSCLMDTINQQIQASIDNYVILETQYTKESIKQLAKNKDLKKLLSLYQDVKTSITMVDAYQQANWLFKQKLEYELNYPFMIKTDDGYLPLSK